MSRPTPLQTILVEELRRDGPQPFLWFMERALYDPEHGFYAGGRLRAGRTGDFVTTPGLTPAFAAIIAVLAWNCWKALGSPGRYVFMEQGAGDGAFAAAFLRSLTDAEFREALEYRIIEPFPKVRELQAGTLPGSDVRWEAALPSGADVPENALHFSNELPDAMPVHMCRFRSGKWVEVYVSEIAGELSLTEERPPADACAAFLETLPPVYPEGTTVEVNLAMLDWIRGVSGAFKRGHALVLDYGYSGIDRYDPRRVNGTLSGYRRQQRAVSPIEKPGETDLTSHVDFASLSQAARDAGFSVAEFTEQHRFLMNAARDALSHLAAFSPAGLRFLANPGSMGNTFKALFLSLGAPIPAPWNEEAYAATAWERLGARD